jgi:GntR family transcriptional regulator
MSWRAAPCASASLATMPEEHCGIAVREARCRTLAGTLADELRAGVLAGKYPRGMRLPTEAELVARHRVSRQTVRQAFAELVAERLVYRIPGRGTFATFVDSEGPYLRTQGSIDDLLALSLDTELEVVQPVEWRTEIEAAGRLRLASTEVLVAVVRRLHHGLPFIVTSAYIPGDVGQVSGIDRFTQAGQRTGETLIALIDRSDVGPIAGASQIATVAFVPEDFAALIDCLPRQPVLRIDRLYYNRSGEFVELTINYFNPTRYSYRLELRR